jgi:hypothetical protein
MSLLALSVPQNGRDITAGGDARSKCTLCPLGLFILFNAAVVLLVAIGISHSSGFFLAFCGVDFV